MVEAILEPVTGAIYPICLDGERACPPEDSGGPHGYSRLLGIIANPEHAEYRETIKWLRSNFRPALFDIEKTNKQLSQFA